MEILENPDVRAAGTFARVTAGIDGRTAYILKVTAFDEIMIHRTDHEGEKT